MKFFLFIVCFLFTSFAFSQFAIDDIKTLIKGATAEELVYTWNGCIEETEYQAADLISDALLKKNPNNKNFIYRKGLSTFYYKKDYKLALGYMKKAVTNVSPKHQPESGMETKAPLEAYYYYAYCLENIGDYTEAEKFYKKYLESQVGKTTRLTKTASLKVSNTAIAAKYKATPKKVDIRLIGDSVNTINPEYAPIISPDGTTIYFTSRQTWLEDSLKEYVEDFTNLSPEDIYVSYKKTETTWTKPKKMKFCKLELNEATVSITPDERMLYVYRDTKQNGDLFQIDLLATSRNTDSLTLIKIPEVNTKAWESHIYFNEDNNFAIFSSDRPGGYGGRDLYRIVKLPDGNWSKPQNMGPTINTQFDEDAPFVSIDTKNLYFSSNCERSMGGFDIYTCVKIDDNLWSTPVNLGYPINSERDDIYYSTTADGLKGYFSSNRLNGVGQVDIYEINYVPLDIKTNFLLTGHIQRTDKKQLNKLTDVEVSCQNCDSNKKKILRPRLRDGYFITALEPCRDYLIEVLGPNREVLYTENISTSCELNVEKIERELTINEPALNSKK